MALLEDWKKKRLDRKIQKNRAYLTKKTTSKDGRIQAIEILKEIGTSDAISGLLQRFRLTVPELTQDEEEKKYICTIIRERGDKTIEPLKKFIDGYDEVMHPLTLLAEKIPEQDMIQLLIGKVQDMSELYSSGKTIKLIEMLRHLARYKNEKLLDAALTFIDPIFDDEVILAAIELLEAQEDESVRQPLMELGAQTEITHRIAFRIGDMFEKLHWSIKGHTQRKPLEAKLKIEFQIQRGGYLKRRHAQEF